MHLMKHTYLLISFVFFVFSSCSKSDDNIESTDENRYKSEVFEEVSIARDIPYGASKTLGGVTKNLLLDIYQPKNDTQINRPLVVLAHGGSFLFGSKSDLSAFATLLAKSGYVVASINYRLLDVIPTKSTFKQTVINAISDMKAAVRYFNKDIATNNTYKINPSTIFIGGYSAGAIAALHYAYVNTEAELFTIGGNELVNFVNANGGLEGLSGNSGFDSKIKAVVNISGALFKDNLINNNEPPIYSIHGTDDEVVPYLNGEINSTGIFVDGSGLLHPYAVSQGVSSNLKTIQNGKHSAFLQCPSCFAEVRSFLFSQL